MNKVSVLGWLAGIGVAMTTFQDTAAQTNTSSNTSEIPASSVIVVREQKPHMSVDPCFSTTLRQINQTSQTGYLQSLQLTPQNDFAIAYEKRENDGTKIFAVSYYGTDTNKDKKIQPSEITSGTATQTDIKQGLYYLVSYDMKTPSEKAIGVTSFYSGTPDSTLQQKADSSFRANVASAFPVFGSPAKKDLIQANLDMAMNDTFHLAPFKGVIIPRAHTSPLIIIKE